MSCNLNTCNLFYAKLLNQFRNVSLYYTETLATQN